MFLDHVKVKCSAGKGGNGIVAYRKERYIPKGGPYGGNGGKGGSIVFEADENLTSLDFFASKRHLKAENGREGGTNLKRGRQGKDLILKLPLGTLIKDEKGTLLADLTEHTERFLLVEGGNGGRGNASFKSSTHQTPNFATPGKPGEEKLVLLELKLIADIGLVGHPNAGKTTLLNALCKTSAKSADYPFTTLTPNIGFIESEDYRRCYIADIPGIIEEASKDKGLGLRFLKHIERTKTLLFVIDISAKDPLRDFEILKNELFCYAPKLLKKSFFVVLNKCDLEDADEMIQTVKKAEIVKPKYLFTISALNQDNLASLVDVLFNTR
ncbi:MAG: GTPase Obg [Chlamydiae bacterium]|nr:GTPase Obg [Chlamydiota bacterium]